MSLNQVWWITTAQNPLKNLKSDNYLKRIELCEELIAKENKIKLHQNDEIHSFKLIEALKKKHPKTEFFWIMGSDNLPKLHLWQNYQKFISSVKLAIFSRDDSLAQIKKMPVWNFLKNYDPEIFFTKKLDISSTQIRSQNKND